MLVLIIALAFSFSMFFTSVVSVLICKWILDQEARLDEVIEVLEGMIDADMEQSTDILFDILVDRFDDDEEPN